MTDIHYCPGCASEVDVVGCHIEDRRIAECPECGPVEIAYHADVTEDWLDKNREYLT